MGDRTGADSQLPRALDVETPVTVGRIIPLLLLVVTVLGAMVGLFVGSGRYAAARERFEAALAWLAQHGSGGDSEARRRNAVSLLLHAYVSATGTWRLGKRGRCRT
ncbi:MAG TPA: hypothetical protein VNL96_09540 [Gemmatimonadaceae bacterium]|nr:hypothetical protein [Gemmatimonadaceae bacterium]